MKILMLCPLISSSSFITTYPFAKILSKKHDVEIMGPLLGKKPYIEDAKLKFSFIEPKITKPIQLSFLSLYKKNLDVIRKKEFDVIHAFKLLPHTGPVGAKIKKKMGTPFVLSIDDYDVAASKNKLKNKVMKWAEKSYKEADAITVASENLRSIYGGSVVYQVANEYAFKKPDPKKFIKKHNLEGKKIIAYAGTFYDHKGIDILIKAVKKINSPKIKLVLAGGPDVEKYRKMSGKETLFTGKIPINEVADLTAAADIYVIPTKDSIYARAEIPAKIFEPMMLGKPVIASKISDIPKILSNGKCGLLTKPGSVEELADKIMYLIDNPKEMNKIASNAKNKYDSNYSYKEMEKRISRMYLNLIDH
ncbi:MAG: glycosyltransferase family 4 protein [Candidatus Aenigmatarchaeota archaeon]